MGNPVLLKAEGKPGRARSEKCCNPYLEFDLTIILITDLFIYFGGRGWGGGFFQKKGI